VREKQHRNDGVDVLSDFCVWLTAHGYQPEALSEAEWTQLNRSYLRHSAQWRQHASQQPAPSSPLVQFVRSNIVFILAVELVAVVALAGYALWKTPRLALPPEPPSAYPTRGAHKPSPPTLPDQELPSTPADNSANVSKAGSEEPAAREPKRAWNAAMGETATRYVRVTWATLDGSKVRLTDGSYWLVPPEHRATVANWDAEETILVDEGEQQAERQRLINLTRGEEALVVRMTTGRRSVRGHIIHDSRSLLSSARGNAPC
jgi:hypothetical protein